MTSANGRTDNAPSPDSAAAIAAIYERYKDTISEQVAVLEDAVAALTSGMLTDALRERAHHDAHKLAGSAGTFGFPRASELAREIETFFQETPATTKDPDVARLTAAVVGIREEISDGPTRRRGPAHDPTRPVLLVVDDDEEFTEQIATQARARDLVVDRVAGASRALARVVDDPPAAALISLALKDDPAGGRKLLADVRRVAPDVPVLVISDRDAFSDRVEVARLGSRAFFEKPVAPSHVLDAVDALFDRVQFGEMTVLTVDDNPLVLETVVALLEPHGVKVVALDDPRRFWQVLEEADPDLLMLDVDMPFVDGVNLCRVVRNDPRRAEVPILFLTAHNDPSVVHRIFESGADDFVTKPIVGPELVMRISNRLARLRLYRRLAETDSLTGASNRRKSTQQIAQLMKLADRYGQPLSVGFIDLDRFKWVNDRHGHAAGDRVLRGLTKLLMSSFRGEDVVARWGGEEFFIALYGSSRENAVQRLAEVLESFRAVDFIAGDDGERIVFHASFSAGVAQYPDDGSDLHSLYRAADAALYEAKATGRNRVVPAGWRSDDDVTEGLDVVVVEDDPALAADVTQALETRGLKARWIDDGSEAALLLTGPRPRVSAPVVVLDWELPGLDGMSVLRRLAESDAGDCTRVIMVTSGSSHDEVLDAVEAGAYDHVAKPVAVPVLMQRVRRALER